MAPWTEIEGAGGTGNSGTTLYCVQGALLAPSAGSITPTNPYHHVSTGTVSTIATTSLDTQLVQFLALTADGGTVAFTASSSLVVSTTSLTVGKTIFLLLDGTNIWREINVPGLIPAGTTAAANTVYAGPTTGGATTPAFRALVAADIPTLVATYANLALSNLASVAINTTLLPASDNTLDLGSSSKRWRTLYVGTSAIYSGASSGTTTVVSPAAAGSSTVTWPNASSTLPIFGQQITFTGPTAARSIALPDAAFTVVGLDSSQTLTNKTISGASNTITNVSLTAGVTGILPGANGGSGNGFFAVGGPTTSLKTFAFPDASATVLTSNAPVTVAQGGSGVATTTAYAVLCGGTTSTNPLQSIASVGTAGQVLTSNGASALPSFQNSLLSARNSSDHTNAANQTLANITGLSVTVLSGTTYYVEAGLFCENNNTGGAKFGIGGTATITSMQVLGHMVNTITAAADATGRLTGTTLGQVVGRDSTGGDGFQVRLFGVVVVNAGGTITVTTARNSASGTMTVYTNSSLVLHT